MKIEQMAGNKPNFGLVALMAATALLGIIIAAAFIVGWRAKHTKKGPFDKHPTAYLSLPAGAAALQAAALQDAA